MEISGTDHFYNSKGDLLKDTLSKMDMDVCSTCSKRIFEECKKFPNILNKT